MPFLSVSGGRGVIFLWFTIASHRNEISLHATPFKQMKKHTHLSTLFHLPIAEKPNLRLFEAVVLILNDLIS